MIKQDNWPPLCLGKFYENVFGGLCYKTKCDYRAACKNEAEYENEMSEKELSEINHTNYL